MKILKRCLKALKKPLSASKIRFSYKDQEVLRDISVNLKEKEIIAIIGKSGSGKSTFLKLISGILSGRYKGKIKIFGKPKFLSKKRIGFIPQEMSFIPDLNLEDNIKIAGLNTGLGERKSLKQAEQLAELLKLDEPLTKKPSELSGGQKVRLNIILSLLHNPDIIILDEPFVGLDFKNRRILWHFINTLKQKGKSIILTSHLLTETQEYADKFIILKNGKILFRGKLEKLKEKLKIKYIIEIKFSKLSKQNLDKIEKYLIYNDLKILDKYNNYMMISLKEEKDRKKLERLFSKLNLDYNLLGFREPNLDEIFLRA
ncbi:MAG: ABC transporter ATP-binding protein [Candidatus Nanoarchaeia archaeon]